MTDQPDEMRDLLLAVLRSYETKGEGELASAELTQYLVARYGSVGEAKAKLGELPMVRNAFLRMQARLNES